MSNASVVLESPASYVACVPHLIGFQPEESMVVTWMDHRTIIVTQRADLADALVHAEEMIQTVIGHRPDGAIIAMFYEGQAPDPDKVTAFADLLEDHEVAVRDILWIKAGHWGSLLCADPECCTPEGKAIKPELAAPLVVAGASRSPVSHRETLIEECRPGGKVRVTGINPKDIEKWRDKAIASGIDAFYAGEMTDTQLRLLGRSLHDIRVRDVLLKYATELDETSTHEVYALASHVARVMHPKDAAPACTVAAIAAWLTGDGARATIAIEHAQASDPDYSLAHLVRVSLENGMPPSEWLAAMENLSFDTCRNG